jgi:GT2 family glycosyltransferase
MNNLLLVDVVLLSFNRCPETLAAIKSVFDQEKVQPILWVVDQGSETETIETLREVAKGLENFHLIEVGHNLGPPGGRNLGMKMGKAPYVVVIDNDAEFASTNAIFTTIQRFEKEPELGVIGFRILNYFTGKDDEVSWAYPIKQKTMRDQEFYTTRYVGCGHAFLRSVLEKSGYYDESLFFYHEEIDISFKIIALGYKLIYFPSVIVRHKTSSDSRVTWKNGRYYYMARNGLFVNFKSTRSWRDFIIRAVGYKIKGLLNGVFIEGIRGIFDGYKMCLKFLKKGDFVTLSPQNWEYIYKFELSYRGSYFDRWRNEILSGFGK